MPPMTRWSWLALALLSPAWAGGASDETASRDEGPWLQISREELHDRIHGGLVGQLFGNLNGLPHEMKYIEAPGDVSEYTPDLADGARTDDDTDIEWVYITAMDRAQRILLPPAQMAALWKSHINDRIWCSNEYARELMEAGFEPPWTGTAALNPWAEFNISGQFLCECFGLIAPGMPRSASEIALHYTNAGIEGEPAQATQLFASMIAAAFFENDLEAVLDAGIHAVDPSSEVAAVVRDARRWHRESPGDWKPSRERLKNQYSRHGGAMRDRNGYELNTGATILALLYGDGDLPNTLRTAFNLGWDADNSAATAGSIVGVMKGFRWMQDQGWRIQDRYRNTTRPGMPEDETISRFASRLSRLAEQVILERGGGSRSEGESTIFLVRRQSPTVVQPMRSQEARAIQLRRHWGPWALSVLADSGPSPERLARAAYLAIALDLAEDAQTRSPEQWRRALRSLERQDGLMRVLSKSPTPAAEALRRKAVAAGLSLRP